MIKLKYITIILILVVNTIISTSSYRKGKTCGNEYYYNKCLNFLKSEEGLMLKPYRCTSKKWTIGYGHRIKKDEWRRFRYGISEKVADSLLISDYNNAIIDVKSITNNKNTKYIYLYAILCFQTGKRGFEEFDDFIAAMNHTVNNSDPDSKMGIYETLKDSKLYYQAKNRTNRYIELLVKYTD